MIEPSLETITQAVLEAYGSLESLMRSFVFKRHQQAPYQSLIERLRASFDITDHTDLNYDVCLTLSLMCQGKEWGLDLSLVGRYALLRRVSDPNARLEVISSEAECETESEKRILSTLEEEGVVALDLVTLKTPFTFPLDLAPEGETTVYHVLIRDQEFPFWRPVMLLCPLQGVGPVQFGMTPTQVREALGEPFTSFLKEPLAEFPSDAFDSLWLHVHYKAPGVCVAMEFARPGVVMWVDGNVLEMPPSYLRHLLTCEDPETEENPDGFTSHKLGIAAYIPGYQIDPAAAQVERIFVFEEGYYGDG